LYIVDDDYKPQYTAKYGQNYGTKEPSSCLTSARPRPCSLGFRRSLWWAAEADYPPTTCGGSPPRLLMIGWGRLMSRGRGRADDGCLANGVSQGLWSSERQKGKIDG
jgi:hypothetical protein